MMRILESRRLVAACVAIVVAGVGAAVLGTYSTYTTARTTQQKVTAGVFAFDLADPAGSTFSTDISGLAPGDFGDRLVDLANTGAISYASVALTATASPTSALDTDAANGLQVSIDRCSVPWVQASNSVAATCADTTPVSLTTMTPVSAIKGSGPSYTTGLTTLVGGANAVDHLRFHYSLPSIASGTSGMTSTLHYTFTATQAPGGAYH